MGLQFDWHMDGDDNELAEPELPSGSERERWLGRPLLTLLTLTLLAIQTPQPILQSLDQAILFAVPNNQIHHFSTLAAAFMAENVDSDITIVSREEIAADPIQLLQQVDAAVLMPDVALLETGAVYPLDELVQWDAADFYPQAKSGIGWNGQMWLWPHAMQMNLLYADSMTIEQTGLDDLIVIDHSWNFRTFEQQINLIADRTDKAGMLLSTRDLLFAHAYAHADALLLDENTIMATLDWASALLHSHDEAMLELSGLSPMERQRTRLRMVSADRKVALWTDSPGRYEYLTQLSTIMIMPWPHSDTFRTVAPIQLHGSVISLTSRNPALTMAWLNFVSKQSPPNGERFIPARRSVADANRYWERLPSSLAEPMNTAFATAQAITIADHSALSWERIHTNIQFP